MRKSVCRCSLREKGDTILDEWQKIKREEIIGGICSYFELPVLKDPEKALSTIEQELENQAIHQGNDWLDRGVVGDTVINATIEGLEIVRSDCLAILKNAKNKGCNSSIA